MGAYICFLKNRVPEVGIEPTPLARHDFKSCAYTNSATRAIIMLKFSNYKRRPGRESHPRIFLLQRNALLLGYQADTSSYQIIFHKPFSLCAEECHVRYAHATWLPGRFSFTIKTI